MSEILGTQPTYCTEQTPKARVPVLHLKLGMHLDLCPKLRLCKVLAVLSSLHRKFRCTNSKTHNLPRHLLNLGSNPLAFCIFFFLMQLLCNFH